MSHPGDPAKGLRFPRRIRLWRPVGFDYKLTQEWETDSWKSQTKPFVHQDPGERSSNPQETDPDLPVCVQESPTVVYCRIKDTECGNVCTGPFEGGRHYLHCLHRSLVSGQNNREGTQPCPSAESWIKDLLAGPRPSK